jgi:hypothetical protein
MSDLSTLSTLTTQYQHQLLALVARENARHMMDTHLPFDVLQVVEEELLPALEAVQEALDWEPSDADLGGELPMTAAELHSAAWQQHQDTHN